jgi:restriction endonuclease S subunit
MIAPATGKAFAVLFEDLLKWDFLSLSLARFSHVRTPLIRIADLFTVRKEVVPEADFESGKVRMAEKVTFDGEVFLGRERTRMTQYLAMPGDLLVSKIRARQGSVGLLTKTHGPASVTIHYRVLTPRTVILPEYAWLALRSNYVRNQFLAATGGAMKGEISEGALLDLRLPCPDLPTQTAIVDFWNQAESAVAAARSALADPVNALNERLLELYRADAPHDVIHTRFFALNFKDLEAWDVKLGRASAFRLACPSFRPMGEFIEETTELVRPSTEPEKEWPVYGVNNKEGVFLNSHQKGKTFNASYKRIRKDWFFHNPTRCNVGSLGIVPDVPEDAITSPEYQVWRVKEDTPDGMIPSFVAVLIQTPFFIDLVQFNRVGAVKQRMYTENLCQLRIPYLPEPEQRKYAQAREKALAYLDSAKVRLAEARKDVETIIIGSKSVPVDTK